MPAGKCPLCWLIVTGGRVLVPATEFAQEQFSVAARLGNVVEERLAADFVGVFDDEIAEAEDALRDGGGDGHVLNVAQGDVACLAGDESLIDLDLGVGQRVFDGVSPEMLESRDEQERERDEHGDGRGDVLSGKHREQDAQAGGGGGGGDVANADEEKRGAHTEDDPLRFVRVAR